MRDAAATSAPTPRRKKLAGHIHGFVTGDGTPPDDFLRSAREQLAPYDVAFSEARVAAITPRDLMGGPLEPLGANGAGGFQVRFEGGDEVHCRRVVLAMGVIDEPPEIPGVAEARRRLRLTDAPGT